MLAAQGVLSQRVRLPAARISRSRAAATCRPCNMVRPGAGVHAAMTTKVASEFDHFPVSKYGRHRSDAQQRIKRVPPMEVDGPLAICTGGAGALGHPTEFMQLSKQVDEPETCKYCGLRYVRKPHHH